MQQCVYECRMNNVDELKQHLIAVWDGTLQNVITQLSCDFQGSGAAQNRWGGKIKRLFDSL